MARAVVSAATRRHIRRVAATKEAYRVAAQAVRNAVEGVEENDVRRRLMRMAEALKRRSR